MICDDALRQQTPTTIYLYGVYVYTMWYSMWTSHRRRCVRFTEFFFRFYRIRGILMSVATAAVRVDRMRASARPAATHNMMVVIRFYLICIRFTHTHTHTTSNNSSYNDGLKYVFVIFILFIFFLSSVRYTRRKPRPEY